MSDDSDDIFSIRKSYLDSLREGGGNPFPNDFRRKHLAKFLHSEHGEASKEELATAAVETAVAGRVMLRRMMGKASFLTVADVSGQIQLYVRRDDIGEDKYDDYKHWDIGDIVGARGVVMKTNKGELSVHVSDIQLLTKSLRPLPEKHAGLTDTETRYYPSLCNRRWDPALFD